MAYRIGLVSLGCEKNRVDAEMMLAKLQEQGYQLVTVSDLYTYSRHIRHS